MKLTIFLMLLIAFNTLHSQSEYTMSGFVKDSATGEVLIGSTISILELKTGAYTNAYGFYSITIPAGKYKISANYIGYKNFNDSILINKDIKYNIELTADNLITQDVIVTAEKQDHNITSIEMSSINVSTETIKKMPALLGEVDIIKSIQLLPGVSNAGEGSSGFNVRGGSISQNLILLDEAPVYNSSHLLGFFSVFNPDAVKDVKLIKGGVPAQYGGRTSSILDVRLKEGNNKNFNINGGLGVIFSRLTVEGPIIEDKFSFLLAGRRSYIDLIAKPFLEDDLSDAEFYFYDLTAKANYIFNDNNRIFISGYFGRDVFGTGFTFDWGSQTLSTRWNHLFSNKLFSNLTYYYSNYDYAISMGEGTGDDFDLVSNIVNQSLKYDLDYFLDTDNSLAFGLEAIYYDFVPGSATVQNENETVDISLENKYAFESSLYIDYKTNITDLLKLKLGLRGSLYNYIGPGEYYEYGDTEAGRIRLPLNTKKADNWESIKSYYNIEPRASIQYQIDDKSSVKASYNRMAQYIHLLLNTAATTPLNTWTPSTNNIKPGISDQYAFGYFRNMDRNRWETSIEVYYKDMQNQIECRDGADLRMNKYVEGDLLFGDGRAYGMELYIKKNSGVLSGWLSYTLSRSENKVDGISNNQWFPIRFDKTHNVNIVLLYDINDNWEISSNFIYSTGTPATYPTNGYWWQNTYIPHNYSGLRNNERIPDYHRLDLSVTYKPYSSPDAWWKGEWVLSLYNVYNRKNPYSVYPEYVDGNAQATQLSIIGSIVPSISYNFNLDFAKRK